MKVYILEICDGEKVVARKEVKTMTVAEARRRAEIFLKEYNGQNKTKHTTVRAVDAKERQRKMPDDF